MKEEYLVFSESKARQSGYLESYRDWAKSRGIDLRRPAKKVKNYNPYIKVIFAEFPDEDFTVNPQVFVPVILDKELEDYL